MKQAAHASVPDPFNLAFVPQNDSTSGQIIGAHFYRYFIAWQNADIVHPHFSGNSTNDLMTIFQSYPEHCVGQSLNNNSFLFNQ